ncbi:immunoglobulin-like domain-containing protein [Patescibacteria group bacterium]
MKNALIRCVFVMLFFSASNIYADSLPDAPQQIVDLTIGDINNHGGKVYNNDTEGFFDGPVALGSAGQDTVVLFINGVWNDVQAFKNSRMALESILPYASLDGPAYGFYNVSAVQTAADIAKLKCPMLADGIEFVADPSVSSICAEQNLLLSKTKDVWEAMIQTLSQNISQSPLYIIAEAVENLEETLRLTVESGKRVILVVHSQGNFFVRAALWELVNDHGWYGERLAKSIGVVMIGSPIAPRNMPGKIMYDSSFGYVEDNGYRAMGIDMEGGSPIAWIASCYDPVAQKFNLDTPYCTIPTGYNWSEIISEPIGWKNVEGVLSEESLSNVLEWVIEPIRVTEDALEASTITEPVMLTCSKSPNCGLFKNGFNFDYHAFTGSYLREYLLNEMTQMLSDMNRRWVTPTTEIAEAGDHVQTIDNLNVRSTREADNTYINLIETAGSGSTGVVMDNGQEADGYYWYNVCFDGASCGYVASNWLEFDLSQPPAGGEIGTLDTLAPATVQVLEQAPTGFLTVAGGLTLPAPNTNDVIEGFGGCTDCSTSAPSQFEMTASTISCSTSNTGGNATINWNGATGATSYNVYRDSELVASGLTSTTYADNAELELGKTYLYFVKALNANGSRNADNSWYPQVSNTLCGDPEPPAPYTGSVPSIATMGVSELMVYSARLHQVVNPNGVALNTFFEYGETPSLGLSTNQVSQGSGTDDYVYSYPISGLLCGTEYFYRVVGEYWGNDTSYVYGDTLSFTTPVCASVPPTDLSVTHDVARNALVLSWDEPILSSQTYVQVERKIVSDPRPGILLNEWSHNAWQDSNYETHSDTWLSPQPGSEYCYRIRTWNSTAGSAGYSDYTDEPCMTIEGTFVWQVDFPDVVTPKSTPDIGIELDVNGGHGVFNIQRKHGDGEYVVVGSSDVGMQTGFDWMDIDVIPGDTYCYRFEQHDQISPDEYCIMYVDSATFGTPALLSLTATDSFGSNGVMLEWVSAITDQGRYEIWRYGMHEGSMQWFMDQIVYGLSKELVRKRYPEDTTVCFKVRPQLNEVLLTFSNSLCISDGDTSIEHDTSPTLTLTGGNETIEVGTAYTDPGFIATNLFGHNISSVTVVSGTVNTSVAGTYTITYSVTDSFGSTTQVTRTVEVILNPAQVADAQNQATKSFLALPNIDGSGGPEIAAAVSDPTTIFKVLILDVDTNGEVAVVTPVVQSLNPPMQ